MNNINDMKTLMLQISSIMENETLIENPISDAFASAKHNLGRAVTKTKAGFGSKRAKGTDKKDKLAKKMLDGWYNWLGLTGKQGNINDLKSYLMAKVGFSESEANELMNSVGDNILGNGRDPETSGRAEQEQSNDNNEESTEQENNNDNYNIDRTEAEPVEPEEHTPDQKENKNLKQYTDELSKLMNLRSHGGSNRMMNFREMASNVKKIVKTVVDDGDDISLDQKIDSVSKALDGLDFITTNDRNSELDQYTVSSIRTKVKKLLDSLNAQKQSETNESINEDISDMDEDDEIDRSSLIDFFTKAAGFAYSHNLVGKTRAKNQYGVPVDNGYNRQGGQSNNSNVGQNSERNRGQGQNYQPYTTQEKDQNKFNRRMDNVWDKAETLGFDSEEIQDIKRMASKHKFEDINRDADIRNLAAIGWSFLRTL